MEQSGQLAGAQFEVNAQSVPVTSVWVQSQQSPAAASSPFVRIVLPSWWPEWRMACCIALFVDKLGTCRFPDRAI